MTDEDEEIEKQADEIANERYREQMCWGNCNIHKNHHCGYWHYNYECALKGIEYGLAEGRKEIEKQWHDLRKNPDDLPNCEEKQQIIFYVKEYNTDIEKDTSHFCLGFYAKSFMNDDIKVFVEKSKGYECEHLSQEVIKWCELPTYKE